MSADGKDRKQFRKVQRFTLLTPSCALGFAETKGNDNYKHAHIHDQLN